MTMSKNVFYKIFSLIITCIAVQGNLWSQNINLVPRPLDMQTTGKETFTITPKTVISVEKEEQKTRAE